ncbi:hypothetical protein LCGC14_2489840, partial [marine sediment metagenome]
MDGVQRLKRGNCADKFINIKLVHDDVCKIDIVCVDDEGVPIGGPIGYI